MRFENPSVVDEAEHRTLLRTATSHTNLRQHEAEAIAQESDHHPIEKAQIDLRTQGEPVSEDSAVPAPNDTAQSALAIGPDPRSSAAPQDHFGSFTPPISNSLEVRRRQPPLSLKLENNVLAPPRLMGRHQSTISSGASTSGSSNRPSFVHGRQDSQLSSGPFSSNGGMTPGYNEWDQTPYLIMSKGALSESEGPLGEPSPKLNDNGQSLGFTMASVRKHVRHRLTVAKQGCDRDLRFIISDITAFVEETMHLPEPIEESDIEQEECLQEIVTNIGKSPRNALSGLIAEGDVSDREIGSHTQGKLSSLSRGFFCSSLHRS